MLSPRSELLGGWEIFDGRDWKSTVTSSFGSDTTSSLSSSFLAQLSRMLQHTQQVGSDTAQRQSRTPDGADPARFEEESAVDAGRGGEERGSTMGGLGSGLRGRKASGAGETRSGESLSVSHLGRWFFRCRLRWDTTRWGIRSFEVIECAPGELTGSFSEDPSARPSQRPLSSDFR